MNDTICAISTASGVGAISIVRVSGPEAIHIVNQIFEGKDLTKVASHTISYGHIIEDGKKIDEVLVSVMRAPKTFTTEDVVEINCHGGIATTNKVLELCLTNGARLADPGEFTKRAFLNDRIDLIKSEAIGDLINAQTEIERNLAINQLTGNISKLINGLRSKLVALEANIEVNIDYPEYEDIEEVTHEKLLEELSNMVEELEKIIKEANDGKIIKNGINVCLIGRPNVGKSSVLNALLQEEKAIVTDIAGTTRDLVEGTILLDGIKLNLIDTAGIRETDDKVEQIGVEKSISSIKNADLVILILNHHEEMSKEDEKLLELAKNAACYIVLINKSDLKGRLDASNISVDNMVYGNTVDMTGLDDLKQKIKDLFHLDAIGTKDPTYLSNARQIALAKQALEKLKNALKATKEEVPLDLIEIDIMAAWNTLGEIIGATHKDELLDELFSRFCIGK